MGFSVGCLFSTRYLWVILISLIVINVDTKDSAYANEPVRSLNGGLRMDVPVVNNDDQIDAYVGTGGLLLPSSFSGSTTNRQALARCLNCVWRFTIYCAQDTQEMCAHAVTMCPIGQIRYRIRFAKADAIPKTIGSVCWGSSKPITREKIGLEVLQRVLRYVPELRLGMNPTKRTITMVPIIVWCGQAPDVKLPQFQISGLEVTVTASANWLWNWGDGTSTWTRLPGKQYPSTQLTHQFNRAGVFTVSVRSHWSGNYHVKGIGNFTTIGPPITQFAAEKIVVVNQDSRLSH